ncbi:MAG: hypothetical protein Q8O88_05160 [bacterium]|nr:hypothetical protein [bacterium]
MNNIIKTLVYFDIFNTPLTREEIFRWSWEHGITNFLDLIKDLEVLVEKKIIESKNGYYFLANRENNIYLRQKTVPIVEEKMQIAVRAIKKIRWVPYVEAVFVCNTVAGANAKKESDIDVFIVTRKGRLWISRLLTTVTLGIFRLRRNKKNVANKICLSFYATDTALDLSKIKIVGTDIYLTFWLDNLIPVYDVKNIQSKIKTENPWLKNYLPNAKTNYNTLPRWVVADEGISKFIKIFFERSWRGKYGDMIEAQAKGIQKTKMKLNFMSTQNKDNTGVVISDSMLKFHENDRREEYRKIWEEKINFCHLNI